MNKKIAEHVDELFASAPATHKVLEIKEELLADLNDKYQDLLAKGKSEEAAYSLVISGIGDIHDLLRDFSEAGPYSAAEAEKKRNLGNLFISTGVAVAVLSLAVFFLLSWYDRSPLGFAAMFVLLAVATGLVVYGVNLGKMLYEKRSDTFVEHFKEKASAHESNKNLKKAVASALWPLIVVIYLAISFLTGRWAVTWIIFILGALLQQFIDLRFFASPAEKSKQWYGVFWTAVVALYFIISFAFTAWAWSWILFIAGAALQQIIVLLKRERS